MGPDKIDISRVRDFKDLLNGLEPTIGSYGGRKFIHKDTGKAYTMNTLVKEFDKLVSKYEPDQIKEISEEICDRIKSLDLEANQKLKESSTLIKVLSFIRRFPNNFYNRQKVLEGKKPNELNAP